MFSKRYLLSRFRLQNVKWVRCNIGQAKDRRTTGLIIATNFVLKQLETCKAAQRKCQVIKRILTNRKLQKHYPPKTTTTIANSKFNQKKLKPIEDLFEKNKRKKKFSSLTQFSLSRFWKTTL